MCEENEHIKEPIIVWKGWECEKGWARLDLEKKVKG